MDTVLSFSKAVGIATISQLMGVFGSILFFGFILYFLARFTRNTFVKSVGQKFDIFYTGWIGVPIHELGHALFCLVFFHKIVRLSLFSPNKNDGSIGFVDHSYNPKNIWAVIGNFFIGFGPLILGSLVLYFLYLFLIPNSSSVSLLNSAKPVILTSFTGLHSALSDIKLTGIVIFDSLFAKANFTNWQFWLFLYLAVSVASHMQLSPSDIKGAWKGFLALVILFLVVNVVCQLLHADIEPYANSIGNFISRFNGIFMLAVTLSALFFTISYVLFNLYTLIRFKKLFHPFG